jgi:glycosyltransferase involved in cell wall biosynthesis
MDGTVFSLILPAYNPGAEVVRTWHAVDRFVADQRAAGDAWEALFVLDGCTDGTAERLAELGAGGARVRVLSYPQNRGKGHAVRTGLLAARGAYRLFTDVDLAYSFEDVLRVAGALRAGAEVAIASREHPDSRMLVPPTLLGYTFRRRVQSLMFRAAVRRLLPLYYGDTQAGLKGMTAAVAEWVVPALSCDGFGFDCEFLTACARAGVAVTETPVTVRYEDRASTTGTGSGLRMLREVWRIRRRWRHRALGPVPAALPASKAA